MKEVCFKIIDDHTIELTKDMKVGEQIDLSANNGLQVSNISKAFKQAVDEIVNNQVNSIKDEHKQELKDQLERQKEDLTKSHNEQIELIVKNKEHEINDKYISQINELKNTISNLQNSKKSEIENIQETNQLKIDKLIAEKSKEAAIAKANSEHIYNELKSEKDNKINDLNNQINSLKQEYESKLKDKDLECKQRIDEIKQGRSYGNTKQLGESLENWCDEEYKKYETAGAFENCEWIKTTKEIDGTKPDYLFKVFSNDSINNEKKMLTSICCEMKTEQANATIHKKNKDHFDKLIKDAQKNGAEFALLITTLEPDKDFVIEKINNDKNVNMYMIRPSYFITFLSLIKRIYTQLGQKIQEIDLEKLNMKQEYETKEIIEQRLQDFKNGLIENSIKHIKKHTQSIIKNSNEIRKLASKIEDEATIIIESHLQTVENKIKEFTFRKITSKLNKEVINNLFSQEQDNSNISIAYCKPDKEEK